MLALQTQNHSAPLSQNMFSYELTYLSPLILETKKAVTEYYCLQKSKFIDSIKLKQRFAKFLVKIGDYEGALEITNIGKAQLRGPRFTNDLDVRISEQPDRLYKAYKQARQGDIQSAKITLNQLQNEPIQEYLLKDFIRLYATLGQFDEAKVIYCKHAPNDDLVKYEAMTYIAIARARFGDLEGARNALAYLKEEILAQNIIITSRINSLVMAQIKIHDFEEALNTIEQFRFESFIDTEGRDELLLKLSEAQFKAGKIDDANKTAEQIKTPCILEQLNYILENKSTYIKYWKITNYWRFADYCNCINSNSRSCRKNTYRFWHEKFQNFANIESLDVLMENEIFHIQENTKIEHLDLEKAEERSLRNNVKIKYIALKIFAAAKIQEGRLEDAIAAIHKITDSRGRASIFIELLEEYFELKQRKFN